MKHLLMMGTNHNLANAIGAVGTTVARGSDSTNQITRSKASTAVKTLAFVLFGVVVLFATDVIEFKQSSRAIGEAPSLPFVAETVVHKTTIDAGSSHPGGTGTATRHTYQPRGQPMSDDDRRAMIEKWGSWTLEDPKRPSRPTDDYYARYPNRDVPRNEFPSNAWQLDKDYLGRFLQEGLQLVERAQRAILEEYGQPTDGSSTMFRVTKFADNGWAGDSHDCQSEGGCTTQSSWDNLKRRLLHAVMTEDVFVFAMGGHSAAAGHGNIFQQSYTLQVQWILEAVFARLGVRHQSRNFGMGGLGTTQNGIATKAIYGYDVDMLLWDSGRFLPRLKQKSVIRCQMGPLAPITNTSAFAPLLIIF